MDSPREVGHRAARPGDAAALIVIDVATQTTLSSPAGASSGAGDPFATTSPDDVLVAEVDGHVVGYVEIGRPSPLPSNAHVWQVQGLAVDPRAQEGGVGRSLLEEAIELVRRRGGRKVSLRVLAPNAPARRLYERAGFVVEGVLAGEFVLDGESVDDVLMALHL